MMTATILFPLVFAIAGALLYALAPGKISELGRLTFLAGMLALAYVLSGKALHL